MPTPSLSEELLTATARLYREHGNSVTKAADAIGVSRTTMSHRVRRAAATGFLGTDHVLPGFQISQVTETPKGKFVQQKPEHGERFKIPPGQMLKRVSALTDADDRVIVKWNITDRDAEAHKAAMRAVVEGFKDEIPRAEAIPSPKQLLNDLLLNQFTVTDLHFGMLSWKEETGTDYDLKIAEKLLLDWFRAAIAMSPPAETAVLCQLGDLLHHDSHLSVTPTHAHVLDADSRLQKIIRIVIRTMRQIVAMLLNTHERVHIIMADANHDPAGGAWLREMFAAFFEAEPRVTVDSSASTYYVYEHGDTSLFYHHGHKRKIANVDAVFAGQFRDIYGRTKFSYAHLGHLHSDELKSTNLMKVERHETLAAPDAFAANGGWLAGRSAKVITYHKQFGEVGRVTLSPEMVAGFADCVEERLAA